MVYGTPKYVPVVHVFREVVFRASEYSVQVRVRVYEATLVLHRVRDASGMVGFETERDCLHFSHGNMVLSFLLKKPVT